MEKELLLQIGIQLASTLIRSALSLIKTLGVEDSKFDEVFAQVKAEFLANDPSKIEFK